jgi:putative membrane protein
MMWHGDDAWSQTMVGGGWLMFLGLILVTVLVVLLVVFLVRQATHPSGSGVGTAQAPPTLPPAPESPREILRRRYAAGEIDREDYLKRLSDL